MQRWPWQGWLPEPPGRATSTQGLRCLSTQCSEAGCNLKMMPFHIKETTRGPPVQSPAWLRGWEDRSCNQAGWASSDSVPITVFACALCMGHWPSSGSLGTGYLLAFL